jgi:hypothetical protein
MGTGRDSLTGIWLLYIEEEQLGMDKEIKLWKNSLTAKARIGRRKAWQHAFTVL